MATVTQSSSFPVPSRQVRITFTLQQPTANYLYVWCTQAPDGSELDIAIKKQTAASQRTSVYTGKAGPDDPWIATFDKGGEYTIRMREMKIGDPFTGGYQDDPRGAPLQQQLPNDSPSSEYEYKIYVGQRSAVTLGASPNTATLIFWVWNEAIQHTSLPEHGEFTPQVIDPTPGRAKAAAASVNATIRAVLTDGMEAVAATGNIAEYTAAMVDRIDSHFAYDSPVHAVQDQLNIIPLSFGGATLAGLPTTVERMLRALRQHFTNDSGTGPGSAAGDFGVYHVKTSAEVSDQVNRPITQGLAGVPDSYMALADVHLALSNHATNLDVHGGAGDTLSMPDIPPLLEVNRRFLDFLAQVTPTPPPGDTIAATIMRSFGADVP